MFDDLWRRPAARRALADRNIAAVFRLLQDAQVSQRRIAQLTEQSQSEVSEILAGRKVVSCPVLVSIAARLGIPHGSMGLDYVDRARCRSLPQCPRQWEPAEIRALREPMRMSG